MDGQSLTLLHTDLRWPNGLTIDYDNQILYWIDAAFGKLESSYVNGSNRALLSSLHIYHPFGLTFLQGNFFWSDWYLNAILATTLEELNNAVYIQLGDLPIDPMGVTAACASRQQGR